jgi:phosphohistidine phosphatase SixA
VVAIVGHEPSLSTFASWLISARPESHLVLKKGGACFLELPAVEPGAGTLEWLLTPKQLRAL